MDCVFDSQLQHVDVVLDVVARELAASTGASAALSSTVTDVRSVAHSRGHAIFRRAPAEWTPDACIVIVASTVSRTTCLM